MSAGPTFQRRLYFELSCHLQWLPEGRPKFSGSPIRGASGRAAATCRRHCNPQLPPQLLSVTSPAPSRTLQFTRAPFPSPKPSLLMHPPSPTNPATPCAGGAGGWNRGRCRRAYSLAQTIPASAPPPTHLAQAVRGDEVEADVDAAVAQVVQRLRPTRSLLLVQERPGHRGPGGTGGAQGSG